MKKIIVLLTICSNLQSFSQEIGARFGNFINSNVAIDATIDFDDNTRLHGDIAFGNGIGANLLYDFKIGNTDLIQNPFRYYLGVGAGTFIGNQFILGVNGEAGVEYLIKQTPITIGLDWRPQLNILSKTAFDISQVGINVRYRLSE